MIDLKIFRGNYYKRTVIIKKNWIPFDLTWYTLFFTVKKTIDDLDSSILINKTITSHTDAINWITYIEILPEDTKIWWTYPNWLDWVYECELTLYKDWKPQTLSYTENITPWKLTIIKNVRLWMT